MERSAYAFAESLVSEMNINMTEDVEKVSLFVEGDDEAAYFHVRLYDGSHMRVIVHNSLEDPDAY